MFSTAICTLLSLFHTIFLTFDKYIVGCKLQNYYIANVVSSGFLYNEGFIHIKQHLNVAQRSNLNYNKDQ